MTDTRAALEAAIDRDPGDPRGYAVLADLLQELGDPRGELIALQLAAEADPSVQPAADAYLARNFARFAGVYAGVAVEWSRGFVRVLTVPSATPVAGDALAHPSSRFVQAIRIQRDRGSARSWIAALAAEPRPALTGLQIGDGLVEIGDLAAVWPQLPNLRSLELYGLDISLGAIALPHLEHLAMRAFRMQPQTIDELARARWPELAALELNPGAASRALWHAVIAMLERTPLPKLAHLALRRGDILDELVPRLAALPVLRQLRTLDLASGKLTDAGAELLARHAEAFAHLERLDATGNRLSPAGVQRLSALACPVVATDQVPDDDPRIPGLYDY